MLTSLGVSGFRSFGPKRVVVRPLRRLNVFVGRNNSGKSNILRLVKVLSQETSKTKRNVEEVRDDCFQPGPGSFEIGIPISKDSLPETRICSRGFKRPYERLLAEWPYSGEGDVLVWQRFSGDEKHLSDDLKALEDLGFEHCRELWAAWSELSTGAYFQPANDSSRNVSRVLNGLLGDFTTNRCFYISDLRKINPYSEDKAHKGPLNYDEFDGQAVIERLFRIQEPDTSEMSAFDEEYQSLIGFVRELLDDDGVQLRIPHNKKEIKVTWRGRVLPLRSLGTGIHEVVILAAAATVFRERIILLEEPELHLHPDLQRKLMSFLWEHTRNQFFITTHSAHIIDFPEANVFHVWQEEDEGYTTKVRHVDSRGIRAEVCQDLGYRASDIVQANAVIWVEGPSDRIYISHWLKRFHGLEENKHYQIMFYGGRLAAHLTGLDVKEVETSESELVSLVGMNRNSILVMDSDLPKGTAELAATKARLRKEFSSPGQFWLTEGRELENYVPIDALWDAVRSVHPQLKQKKKPSRVRYSKVTTIIGKSGNDVEIKKVKVANLLVERAEQNTFSWELKRYRLGETLEAVANRIRTANGLPLEV